MKRITKIEGNTAFLNAVRKTRVAAYCRVSTGSDEQLLSLETQKDHYERYIKAHPDWEYAGLYYDQGITGTKKDKRPALMQMVSYSAALWCSTVGNGFFIPMGLHPPWI